MDLQNVPGQIIIRFGAIQPGQEDRATDVLRDALTYFDDLRRTELVVEDVRTLRYVTEFGGQIMLAGRLQPLVNLALDDAYQRWLTRLQLVFTNCTVVTARGGGNGAAANAIDDWEDTWVDLDRRYAGAGSSGRS